MVSGFQRHAERPAYGTVSGPLPVVCRSSGPLGSFMMLLLRHLHGDTGGSMAKERPARIWLAVALCLAAWYFIVASVSRTLALRDWKSEGNICLQDLPAGAATIPPESPHMIGSQYYLFPVGVRCDFPMADGLELVQYFPDVMANILGLIPAVVALWLWARRHRPISESVSED